LANLRATVSTPGVRDAIARVTYAEAANQGDSGLAAVVYTILNRLQDGRWGSTVDAVLNAPAQFEPVMKVGGDWRGLPAVSAAAQARIDTILNLALDGRLPDLTKGARYFQNPTIVADRARAGQVSPALVNFGGAAPSAVIGAHRFYTAPGRGGGSGGGVLRPSHMAAEATLFVGQNRASPASEAPSDPAATNPQSPRMSAAGDPGQALFVSRQGAVTAARP
jgi:hypothetical protein